MREFVIIIDWETYKTSHIKFDDAVSVQQFLEVILEIGTVLMHQADSWSVEFKGPPNDMKAVRFIDIDGDLIRTYQRIN